MRISEINSKINFKGGFNNKLLLKGLEIAANHPASFIAGTTLLMSSVIRPIAIACTPKTDKENKKYAIADSISSGLIKFGITELVALPVENAIKHINKNPEKYLNSKTIKNFTEKGKSLLESKNYKFAQQLVKNTPSIITAIPKSMTAVALIPFVMNKLFPEKKKQEQIIYTQPAGRSPVFSAFYNNQVSFKGVQNTTAQGISKIFNSQTFQNFVTKHSFNDTNIARNMTIATDILLAGSSVIRTKKSKKIKEDKKKPLIYNKLITTAISVLGGYKIDKMIQKSTKSFIEKFKQANIADPKLDKYIQGINVVRPTLVFALLYYGILPILSTFTADKLDKLNNKKEKS